VVENAVAIAATDPDPQAPYSFATATATCATGQRVVSGGHFMNVIGEIFQAEMSEDGRSWIVSGVNFVNAAGQVVATAHCAPTGEEDGKPYEEAHAAALREARELTAKARAARSR
jgi:hypothetical protein